MAKKKINEEVQEELTEKLDEPMEIEQEFSEDEACGLFGLNKVFTSVVKKRFKNSRFTQKEWEKKLISCRIIVK